MRALWGGGEGGDWGVLGVVLHSKAHDDACRFHFFFISF